MSTAPAPEVLGVWLVGARGAIATMTAVCARLIASHAIDPVGLLTEREPYSGLPLVPLGSLRFGGCDIRDDPIQTTLETLVADRLLPSGVLEDALGVLSEFEPLITHLPRRLGVTSVGEVRARPDREVVDAIRSALAGFREALGGASVIVVYVASTEELSPGGDRFEALATWEQLNERLDSVGALPWGVLYGCAALLEGSAFVNFTPNLSTELASLKDLAVRRQVPHAGKDGKTGETLLKTALAPLFEARGLRVRSWVGYNILGNSDGRSLANPATRDAKVCSKDQQLGSILQSSPELWTKVGIDYVPSLGDWKTAWDFVHFEGILGVKMSMQLLWQGADTVLATPLVLDLIRFVELAWRRGEVGALPYLAGFFKTPMNSSEHDFWVQMRRLREHLGFEESSRG